MTDTKNAAPIDLTGRYVRGADGRVYRVSMRGRCADPWGRVGDMGDVVAIPSPFRECEREVVAEFFEDKRLVKKARKGGVQ